MYVERSCVRGAAALDVDDDGTRVRQLRAFMVLLREHEEAVATAKRHRVARARKRPRVDFFKSRAVPLDLEAAENAVMRAVAALGLPLSVVENSHFQDLLSTLASCAGVKGVPDYRGPSRRKFSTVVLDRVFEQEYGVARTRVLHDAGEEGATISCDAMTSRASKRCLVNVVAQTRNGAIIVDVTDTKFQRKTNRFTVDYIVKVCDKELEAFGGLLAVNEIVVDGGMRHAMKLMRRAVHKRRVETNAALAAGTPPVITSVCVAHTFNLLLKDTHDHCSAVKDTVTAVKSIVRYFRRNDKAHELLVRAGGKRLKISTDVRFGSTFDMIQRFLEDKLQQLRKLVVSASWEAFCASHPTLEKKGRAKAVADAILGRSVHEHLWSKVEILEKTWKPMFLALRHFDAQQARLHTLYPALKRLPAETRVQDPHGLLPGFQAAVTDALAERWKYLCEHTPGFLLAHALNPVYLGDTLDADVKAFTRGYFRSVGGELSRQLRREFQDFRAKVGIDFEDLQDIGDPFGWWNVAPGAFPQLSIVAKRVMLLTGTATECERAWKDYKRSGVAQEKSTLA